jgi:hypothetical protein
MWRDLDLKKGTATIQRVLVRNRKGGGWSFQPTKTPGSRRCIPFPSYLLRKFKSHKRTQNETRLKLGSEWENNDLVFASGFRCALSLGCERNNAIFITVDNQCRHIEVERQSAIPPDTSILWPFTQRFSSDRSMAIIGPTSSGTPARPKAVTSATRLLISGTWMQDVGERVRFGMHYLPRVRGLHPWLHAAARYAGSIRYASPQLVRGLSRGYMPLPATGGHRMIG